MSALALSLLLLPGLAAAQDQGVALNMGRGLDSGMSVNWTFRENWTLRPTLGLGYSDFNGFEAFLGSTVLRSFALGERVYVYGGAGVYFGSSGSTRVAGGQQTPAGVGGASQFESSYTQNSGSLLYFTAPVGLRARLYGNFEAFAETAYQKTMSGQFALNQTGQFSGNGRQRFGATFGVSLRLR
jgi:hypothetical protein